MHNFIDADSHVYEVEETWNYLPKKFQSRRPIPITVPPEKAPYMGVDNSFWLVDGKAIQWTWGSGTVQIGCPLTSVHALRKAYGTGHQSLMDVPMRMKALDGAGIDVQVIYPTIFLAPLTEDDEFESALQISYNHWIQERGLYYPNQWDRRYSALLAASDAGEPLLRGGLLVARYGRGNYIYTSMVWYRQLRAGVPGAYRMFANMISYGHEQEKEAGAYRRP